MAPRGSTKYYSLQQEAHIARVFGGVRSPSSGAAGNDAGDIRSPTYLIEAKMTGKPGKPAKSINLKVADLNKIAEEAYAEGRKPLVALRIHNPESILSDADGNIDLVVFPIKDLPESLVPC